MSLRSDPTITTVRRRPLLAALGAATLLLGACTSSASPAPEPGVSTSAAGPASTPAGTATTPGLPTTGAPPTATDTAGPPVTSGPSTPPASPSSTAGTKPVRVILTYYDWNADTSVVEANAVVPGVIDTAGTCTLVLSRDGVTRQATRKAAPSASSTQCGQLTVPGSQLSPGDWQLTIRYSSPDAAGAAAPVSVRVGS